MDIVLFLIILSAFVMPNFIPVLAFLHSVFTLSLEIICGLLSVVYGIILVKSIYFKDKSGVKINVKDNNSIFNLKAVIKCDKDIQFKSKEEIL